MKKLFLSISIALLALSFSAFTTKHHSQLLTNYWAILADGNYHRLASFDPWTNCTPTSTPGHCAVLWTYSGQPNTDTLPVAAMNQFISDGLAQYVASPSPNYYTKYTP